MVQYKRFIVNPLAVNAFVVYDETKEAIIIDGAAIREDEMSKILNFIREENLVVKYIISTHGHFDHVCGNAELKEIFDAPILMNIADNFWVENAEKIGESYGIKIKTPPLPDKYLNDGDKINFGNSEILVFSLPGHSPGSLIFYSKNLSMVFSGDTLFANSIGRTDFPQGNFNTLITGIKDKILSLPKETIVFPGHDVETTVGYEIANNYYFKNS